jgi:hypothetical protein
MAFLEEGIQKSKFRSQHEDTGENVYSCERLVTAEEIMSNHETHGTHEMDAEITNQL